MALLTYNFAVVGVDTVANAFKTIEGKARDHSKSMSRISRTAKAENEAQASARVGVADKAASRLVSTEAKAAERAASQKRKIDERHSKWRQDLQNRHYQNEAKQRLRADATVERARVRGLATGARLRERAEVSSLRASERMRQGVAGSVGRGVTRGVRAVGAIGAGALAIGGTMTVASAVSDTVRNAKLAGELANQAKMADPNTAFGRKEFMATAEQTKGIKTDDALMGMSAIMAKTGNAQLAIGMMGDLSKISVVTSANMEDLGSAVGHVFNALKGEITDPIEQLKAVKGIMSTLTQQGAKGAVEIKDLATEYGKVGAATHKFYGGSVGLLKKGGAFMQMAVDTGGAPTAAEAATAVGRLPGDIVKHRKDINKVLLAGGMPGVVSKDDDSKLRDPFEIIRDTIVGTGGGVLGMDGLFGDESKKVVDAFTNTYKAAGGGGKGGKGEAALNDLMASFSSEMKPGSIDEMFQQRQTDADQVLLEAQKKLSMTIGTALTPSLIKLTEASTALLPSIKIAVDALAGFLTTLAESPGTAIAEAITAAIVYQIASSALGAVVASTVTKALASKVAADIGAGLAGKALATGGALGGGALVGGGVATGGGVAATVAATAAAPVAAVVVGVAASVGVLAYAAMEINDQLSQLDSGSASTPAQYDASRAVKSNFAAGKGASLAPTAADMEAFQKSLVGATSALTGLSGITVPGPAPNRSDIPQYYSVIR